MYGSGMEKCKCLYIDYKGTARKFEQKRKEADLTQEMMDIFETLPNLGKKQLYNLEVLNVCNYPNERICLKILPDSIGNLENLRILNLSYNDLETLPKSIGNLKNLEELNLSENNNFSELPDSIGNLGNLHTLSLKHTYLKSFPESLGNSENLMSLSVSWYRRYDSSDYQCCDVFNGSMKHWSCPTMEFNSDMKSVSLDLSGKNLKQIPLGVYMLSEQGRWLNYGCNSSSNRYVYIIPALKELDVSNNQLTKIPHLLKKLNQLEKLYIHNNPDLNHLPDFLWEMRSLKELKIDGKLVKYLPNNAQVSLNDKNFENVALDLALTKNNRGKMSDDQLSNKTGPYTVYLKK